MCTTRFVASAFGIAPNNGTGCNAKQAVSFIHTNQAAAAKTICVANHCNYWRRCWGSRPWCNIHFYGLDAYMRQMRSLRRN
jgi:hypothetical protein